MGNWMTVQIVGTCDPHDVPALKAAIILGPDYSNFHCLMGGVGLAGLPVWAAEKIDAVGNLAERDYEVEHVAKQLAKLAEIAPSLRVQIHCGGDNESHECVATLDLANGTVAVMPPRVKEIGEISEDQMRRNMLDVIRRQRGG